MTNLSIFRQHLSPWYLGDLDSFFSFFEKSNQSYPPHNIIRVDDSHIILEMAVAGISKKDIKVTTKQGLLHISFEQNADKDSDHQYRGIATRSFNKSFKIPEDWEVTEASLDNGLLEVKIEYVIPEHELEQVVTVK